jgi:hypothetical protein
MFSETPMSRLAVAVGGVDPRHTLASPPAYTRDRLPNLLAIARLVGPGRRAHGDDAP